MAIPLHAKVAEALRTEIRQGTLAVGEALPSEAVLCERFQTSRGTVRASLATLRQEGLIAVSQGRPPVVRAAVAHQPFESFMSFTAWATSIGRVAGQRTIETARRGASSVVASVLEIDEGAPVVEILRVRLLDGTPAMLERSSFVDPVGRLLFDFDPDSGSIYAYLTSQGVDLHEGRHTIDAVAASEIDAGLLDVDPGAALLRERRRTVSREGATIECAEDLYRPDRVTFTIDNTQPAAERSLGDLRIVKESS